MSAFAIRVAALDHLEVHVFDRLLRLAERGPLPAILEAQRAEAEELRARLQAANERVAATLRRQAQSSRVTPGQLRRALLGHAGPPGRPGSYDALDVLVGALLDVGPPAAESVTREPDMVAYQPTPARAVLALIERAGIGRTDVFYDLGSGLGHVPLLVARLAGARAVGVEIEPSYVQHARRCARRLKVKGVRFVEADARNASLARGTVYFLYTPFRGAMLARVLESLHVEARKRPIRVCTYGPCTAAVARVPWLRVEGRRAIRPDEVYVFRPSREPVAQSRAR